MFGRLLGGSDPLTAARTASRVAAASLDHRGVEGLVERLADVALEEGPGTYLESVSEVQI